MSNNLVSKNLRTVMHRPDTCGKTPAIPFNRFRSEDFTARWIAGPVSHPQRFMKAQYLWSEMKLWSLFDAIKATKPESWIALITFEIRLACSWYFRSDYMDVWPEVLVRRVRNEFCIKRRKTVVRTEKIITSLCERHEWTSVFFSDFFFVLFYI